MSNIMMSKSGLVIITAMMTLAGIGFSQSVTATQIRSSSTLPVISPSNLNHSNQLVVLQITKCTIRRYRRPH
jgi:hypothetical protein